MTETLAEDRSDSKTMNGSVRLRGVVKRFGAATAVDGIDLDVHPGEFLSLLGPSGCGKTTLLRMLAGFETPDEGDILLDGRSILPMPPHKRPVNTVFQSYALFPHMTVAENIAYGLRQRRTPRSEVSARVAEALDMVRMRKFADRSPAALSGGQAQRIGLARALVNRPDVLLLDEPMSALDKKLRDEMQLELKLLQERLGTTFIFVTHDQEEALSMSDRIVVMYDGAVQQVGGAEEIYSRPESAFVAGFIGRQNFFDAVASEGRLETADGMIASDDPVPTSGTVRVAVRPEAVSLTAARPQSRINAISGRLAGVSFLGDIVQYLVVTPSGQEILCRKPGTEAAAVQAGSEVYCTFAANQVQVFEQ